MLKEELYERPEIKLFSLEFQGVVANSGDTETFIGGKTYDDSVFV